MAIPDSGWFYVDSSGARQGPTNRESLLSMHGSGQLSDASLVWAKGMQAWEAFASVIETDLPPPVPSSAIPPVPPSLDTGRDTHERLVRLRGSALNERPSPEGTAIPASVSLGAATQQMSRGMYIGLCFVSWLVGVIVANVVSPLLGTAYAEASIAVIVAFWFAKYVAKDNHREWSSIVAFPIITFASGLLGAVIGTALASQATDGPRPTALVAFAAAFVFAFAFFAVRKRFRTAGTRASQ
jgi:hypothetical protein